MITTTDKNFVNDFDLTKDLDLDIDPKQCMEVLGSARTDILKVDFFSQSKL